MKYNGVLLTLFLIFNLLLTSQMSSYSQEQALPHSGTIQIEEVMIPQEVKSQLNNLFDNLHTKSASFAFNEFLNNSPLKDKKDDIKNLIEQTERASRLYGKFHYANFVSGKSATRDFLRLYYLGIYDKYPMRWIFTFYKSPTLGWIVTNIKLDDLSDFYLD